MGIATHIDGLRKLLGGAPRQQEDERLLQLYWNRVELKKEFSRLQEDNYGLLQQLKKNDAAHGQTQGRLKQIEEFLGNPENASNALIYYQLQAVWNLSAARVAELAQELTLQQQERERRLQLIEFNQQRQRRVAELERALLDAHSHADAVEARLQLMRRKLEEISYIWHYFKRRKLRTAIAPAQQEHDDVRTEVGNLQDAHRALAQAPEPTPAGLTVSGKRLVNTATLAYAQQLVERLGKNSLAPFAKESTIKRVQDVRYGSVAECKLLLEQLRQALQMLHENARDLQSLKVNTKRVRANSSYRSADDTLPEPESIGTTTVRAIGQHTGQDTGSPQPAEYEDVNVLLDNYWDLYTALLH